MVEIRAIGEEYLKTVLAFQAKAITEVGEQFFHLEPENIVSAALQQGRSVGCFDRGCAIAMRLSHASIIPAEFLGKLPIESKVSVVGAKLCGVYVEPNYRNRRLAKTMTSMVLTMLEEAGIQHTYTTVHPQNTPNLRALQANGFQIVYEGIFYKHKPRFLLYKYLA